MQSEVSVTDSSLQIIWEKLKIWPKRLPWFLFTALPCTRD